MPGAVGLCQPGGHWGPAQDQPFPWGGPGDPTGTPEEEASAPRGFGTPCPRSRGLLNAPFPAPALPAAFPPGLLPGPDPCPLPKPCLPHQTLLQSPAGLSLRCGGWGWGCSQGRGAAAGPLGLQPFAGPPLPCTASPAAAVLPRAWTRRGVFWSGGANAGAVRGPGGSPGSGRLRCPPGREQPSAPRAGFCNLTRSGDTCCLSGTYVRGRPPRVSGEASPSPAARPRWPDPLPTRLRRRARGVREPARRLPSTHLPPRSGCCGGAVAGDGGVGWSPRPPPHPAQPSPRLSGVNPFRGCQHPGCAKGAVPGHCGDP